MAAAAPPLPQDTQQRINDTLAAVGVATTAGATLQTAANTQKAAAAAVPVASKALNDAQTAYNAAKLDQQRKGILAVKALMRDAGIACPCHVNAVFDDDQGGETDPNT